MTSYYFPTERESLLLERAAAHVVAASLINPEARFAAGVTDEKMAAVIFRLESGETLTKDHRGRWFAEAGTTLAAMHNLSRVVQEGIRTGLLAEYRPAGRKSAPALIPAKTHQAIWAEHLAMWVTKCDAVGENMGPKRVRLVRDPVIVDCLRCL